ncbi:MAG: hypothetical protein M1830_010338, partial [Pleopsidium flavum]
MSPLPMLAVSADVDFTCAEQASTLRLWKPFGNALVEQELPCTPAQAACLERSPQLPHFSLRIDLLSDGFVSMDRVQFTWQALASHNPVLRTVFERHRTSSGSVAKQLILKNILPLESYSHGAKEGNIKSPAKCRLYSSGETTSVLIQIHRALVDETSSGLIMTDFLSFYHSMAFDHHPPFSSYINHVCSKDPAKAELFWNAHLTGLVNAPIHSIPLLESKSTSCLTESLDQETFERIQASASEKGHSMEALLYTAWAMTMACHTEVTNGTVVFDVVGRDTSIADYDTIVGLVDQTYPLKIRLSPEMSVGELINYVESMNGEASTNAFIGYESIERQAPGFSTISSIKITRSAHNSKESTNPSRRPLSLYISVRGTLEITMKYNQAAPEPKIRVLLNHFLTALENMSKDFWAAVQSIELVSSSERDFLLDHGRATTQPVEGLVHRLFERQVELTPDADALQFEADRPLTYLQLNKVANAVARQLPCGRGDRIPVCMRRSANLIVALLAILKSGAAYVTLDPEIPTERNKFIVEDVGAPWVVSDKSSSGRLPREVLFEDWISRAGEQDNSNLEVDQKPDDIVYVIYTSGSTGKPKGVLLEHRAAYAGLVAFPFIPNLRQLFFHNPVFSAAQRSIWSTLKQGGCLCVASKESLTLKIGETINEMRVNTIDVTPSTAALITPGTVPCLERMTVAGELINPALLPAWIDRVELLNAYGLSENTQFNWRHVMQKGQNPQNIARPSDTTTSYVLAPGTTKLSPLLVPGELCLGGYQLARGYLNRPEKTREAFISNPFGPGRLYRTGDMVVAHEDGSIEVVGRIDFQVKINDQRVEPGESNSIIQMHPNIYASSVVSATIGPRKSLIAAVVVKGHVDWSSLVRELREKVRQQLPLYMVPSYWMRRPELPLNVNGKVDVPVLRQILETLGRDGLLHRPDAGGLTERLSPLEEAIREIWAGVLMLPSKEIRRTDSFLSLGGTSLDAIVVSSSARKLGMTVPVPDLLKAESLSDVANATSISGVEITTEPAPFAMTPLNAQLDRSFVEDAYPATPLQEGLVADSLLGRSNYVYCRAFSHQGLALTDLKLAFQAVITRSKLLRTTFIGHGKSFVQVVQKTMEVPWDELDTSLDAFLESQHQAKTSTKMTLGGPFLRVASLKEDVIIILTHHALFDFWSNQFLYDDLCAVLKGRTIIERPAFSSFVRFVEEKNPEKSHDFWKTYLEEASATNLGTGVGEGFYLETNLDCDLKASTSKHQMSVGSMLYAAWAIALAIQIEKNDILFGVALSGRDAPIDNILEMSGPTLTTVPMRVKVIWDATVLQIAQQLQSEFWSITEYAHYGMRKALRASDLPTNCFDTMVNFLVKNKPDDFRGGEVLKPLSLAQRNLTDYLTLEIDDRDLNRLKLMSLLDVNDANGLLHNTAEILRTLVKAPQSSVGEVASGLRQKLQPPSVSDALSSIDTEPDLNVSTHERAGPLDSARSSVLDPRLRLLHGRFEDTARKAPELIALQWEDTESITYGSLDTRAERLANYLRWAGVRQGQIVPLLLEKSVEAIVAILAVLKAGAAYVPLSPDNPVDRNVFIVKEVEADLVITHTDFHDVLQHYDAKAVYLDQLKLGAFDTGTASIEDLDNTAKSLAYVIYTSGSTGLPKGVKITHAAASLAVKSMLKAEGRYTGQWRTLQFANYVFDASVQDIFNTLSSGGTICMAPTDRMLSDLSGVINEMNVKQAILTPTVARLLSPQDVPSMEILILGGEPMTSDVIETWASKCKVLNVYGPTETSMVVTTKVVSPETNPRNIGKPFDTVSAIIVEIDGTKIVTHGEVGELCIAGPQIAQGYLNRDDLTLQAFVPCDYLDGTLMYRTGDLARWLPDGEIECLGRKDNQVKIAGHRIELGEIEHAILQSSAVHGCAVLVLDVHGKPQVIAFCVFKPSLDTKIADAGSHIEQMIELRDSLKTLPSYMVPRFIFPMGKFPRLPSQKVDLHLLRQMTESLDAVAMGQYSVEALGMQEQNYSPTENNEEALLEKICSDIFQIPKCQIGARANFFALGGDSISAINLASLCRNENYAVSVRDVLKFATLREIAKCLKRAAPNKHPGADRHFCPPESVFETLEQASLTKEAIEYIYPCVPGQTEFLNQGHREEQMWVLMTIRSLPATIDLEHWVKTTVELTRVNEILRTTYAKISHRAWVGVVLKEPVIDFNWLDCTANQRKDMIEDIWSTRFVTGKPFVRYLLLKYPDGKLEIVVKMDHGVWDGTLLRIFDDHFSALQRGKPAPPHEEFKNFATSHWASDKTQSLDFWKTLVRGQKPQYSTAKNPMITQSVVKQVDVNLEPLTNNCGVTVPVVFQAAFQVWLANTSKRDDVSFDYLLTGRNVDMPNPQSIN